MSIFSKVFDQEKLSEVLFLAQIFFGSIVVGVLFLIASFFISSPMQEIILQGGQKITIAGKDPLFKFLFKELGFALIISGLIGTTIDFFTKHRHEVSANKLTLAMQKNIFHAVLGRDLPPKLYEAVKQNVFNAKFYRTEFRVFYELGTVTIDNENPDSTKYIKLSEQTTFVVKNISNSIEKYMINMYIDPCIPLKQGEIPPPKYDYLKVNGADVEFTSYVKETGDDEINAHFQIELSPNESAQIDSSSYSYVRLVDEQVFTLKDPTEGLRITTISHDPSLLITGYVLDKSKFKTIRDTVNMKEWWFDQSLLSGQGFLIKWKNIN